ncbi:hypothetical protein DRE_06042 [Drechslerella stenobrocha 248]|uniref:Ryanodine receptor Ryr domain-containing protein n=1 Tax=Drechslerella stenobrocha 248 TaxID=1043628 RepID=W7HPU2_9PEZI|nr:hypothetical protein DRE_06042 [Drechslerella stenobrocha 248]
MPERSVLEFELQANGDSSPYTLKLNRVQRLDHKPFWLAPQSLPATRDNQTNILVVQDTGGFFSNSEEAVSFLTKTLPTLVLYSMSLPLARGKVWGALRNGPYAADGTQDPEKLVVILSANDLRAEGIQLSYGLSWEKTCEDFVKQLGSVGRLVTLVTCAHLIVLFGCDGVIYHRGRKMKSPRLYFDPKCTEGEFLRQNLGDVPGLTEAFVAGLITGLGNHGERQLKESIELGLSAARQLARSGISLGVSPGDKPDYLVQKVMSESELSQNIFKFKIPSNTIGSGEEQGWSILDRIVGDPAQLAREIVINGTDSLCAGGIPVAQFGRLVLVDRQEIESFRIISNVLRDYIDIPQTKPISIAFFGTRGSGISFAAMQLGEALLHNQNAARFDIDLTQVTSPSELTAMFHSIRDSSLQGSLPLVYFDGFDIQLPGSQSYWLSHLLTPMLHGLFLDQSVSRPIGRAIFFLGAANFKTYESFRDHTGRSGNSRGSSPRYFEEFLGSLHGFVDMLGPDCVDTNDRLYPVRRAVILRELLERRETQLKTNGKISIDDNVLDALLLVPTYRQGIRSLNSIIAMSRLNGSNHFGRAALPPASQLDLHVDHPTFTRYLEGHILPASLREELAAKLHDLYVRTVFSRGLVEADERDNSKYHPWNRLEEELKESNRAHADDIPRKLRFISYFLSEAQDHRHRDPIRRFSPAEIETLAQQEHERWNAERLQKQWGTGERNSQQRKSPFLKTWKDLAPEWQGVDKALVASYPDILPENYKIYKMGTIS